MSAVFESHGGVKKTHPSPLVGEGRSVVRSMLLYTTDVCGMCSSLVSARYGIQQSSYMRKRERKKNIVVRGTVQFLTALPRLRLIVVTPVLYSIGTVLWCCVCRT